MDTNLYVTVGWNALEGIPVQAVIGMPPVEVLMSDGIEARRERIWGPLHLASHFAVMAAFKRSHDADGAKHHRNRPALKQCPHDNACRFV